METANAPGSAIPGQPASDKTPMNSSCLCAEIKEEKSLDTFD